jgi:hypothetical protein
MPFTVNLDTGSGFFQEIYMIWRAEFLFSDVCIIFSHNDGLNLQFINIPRQIFTQTVQEIYLKLPFP